MASPIRVLIVDDSAFIRQSVAKHLPVADPDIQVVGSARDGLDALTQVLALKPDVVILDVEMPRMDGLTALRRIMAECPTPVVMLSAFTQRGTSATVQALMRGAVDFVPKPDATIDLKVVIQELCFKVKNAAHARPATLPAPDSAPAVAPPKLSPRLLQRDDPLVVIGASTGGPRALQQVLVNLPAELPAAILVVQHMPAGFTRSLAQRLHQMSPLRVQEAEPGDRLARGLVLLAPGNFHLYLTQNGQIRLDQAPRRNHVRPAVDITLESAAAQYGRLVIGIILTGMGVDGTAGARCIKAAGGRIIAEHESTSVVYGMPQSVVAAGLADRVVPLPAVAPLLLEWIRYGTSGV